ncbi:MAG: DinB family protein [Puia sp.]|nr:DinB family protein [Puia sp.]
METITTTPVVITPEALLEHWQGHRRLTRRTIEAFPADKLFTYSVGGMRPFSALAGEMISMAGPSMYGFVTGRWDPVDERGHLLTEAPKPDTQAGLLEQWDETTDIINTLWPRIRPDRFQENDKLFNMWESAIYSGIFYLIDNEIHHRGQGYVYLRSLGIEPPPFWERD